MNNLIFKKNEILRFTLIRRLLKTVMMKCKHTLNTRTNIIMMQAIKILSSLSLSKSINFLINKTSTTIFSAIKTSGSVEVVHLKGPSQLTEEAIIPQRLLLHQVQTHLGGCEQLNLFQQEMVEKNQMTEK